MSKASSNKWVAVVYDNGDKVGSHMFDGEEDAARTQAEKWVTKLFGEIRDWSFHQVWSNK